MKGLVQRRPVVWLLALLVFNFLLISLQVRDARGQVLLRSIGLSIIAPPAAVLYFVGSTVGGFFDRYFFLQDAARENERLQSEKRALEIEVRRLRSQVALLPRSLDYQRIAATGEFDTVVAAIIGRSTPFFNEILLISAGTGQGVRKDAAVISPAGVVGRVISAGPLTSEVELITYDHAGAGARLEGSRLEGFVEGLGGPLLQLKYIPNSETVEPGDLVVTSGTDRLYPKGMVIGRVERASSGAEDGQQILVRPEVDFRRLEEVLVIINPNGASGPQPDQPGIETLQSAVAGNRP